MPADNSMKKLNEILNPKDGDLTHLFTLAALELEIAVVNMYAEDNVSLKREDRAEIVDLISENLTFAHKNLAPLAKEGGISDSALLGLRLKLDMQDSASALEKMFSGKDVDQSERAFKVLAMDAMTRAVKRKLAL